MPRALDAHHRLGDLRAGRHVAGGDETLGQHFAVHHFALADAALAAAAHRLLHPANAVDHLGEFIGQQAHLVVVAFHRAIEGDVFLDHHSAKGCGGNRHFNASFMAGIAHGRLGQVAQPLEVAQIDVLEGGGIRGIAVQQHVAGALVLEVADAGADLHFRSHAG